MSEMFTRPCGHKDLSLLEAHGQGNSEPCGPVSSSYGFAEKLRQTEVPAQSWVTPSRPSPATIDVWVKGGTGCR